MANRTVTAELEMKGKDATGPMWKSVAARMGQMEKQFGRFNRTAEQFNSKIKNIERTTSAMARVSRGVEVSSVAALGAVSRFAAPAAIAYGIKNAVVDFAAMERQLNRIANTAGASQDEIKGAGTEITRLSQKFGYATFEPAITALETLTSSGLSLKEAMDFLPSVLETAQASGAAVEDIANTALKSSSALGIQAKEMGHAFDLMVAYGNAGQFELKDMSQYIPSLANQFATLGYSGTDGLSRLLAVLQTIREDTGTAESAAADAGDIFNKMYAPQTITAFKKKGVDLNKELDKAKKNGEDVLRAFVRITREATKGDLSKLSQLFGDKQVLEGMRSLLTSGDSWDKYDRLANSAEVAGSVMRANMTLLQDTQAKLDRLSLSWNTFEQKVGAAASGPVGKVLDLMSNAMDREQAVDLGMEKAGLSPEEKAKFQLERTNGRTPGTEKRERYYRFLADSSNSEYRGAYMLDFADSPQMQKMYGRRQGAFVELPPIDHGYTPKNLPAVGPFPFPGNAPRDQHLREIYRNTGGRISPSASTDFTSTVGEPGSAGVDWKRFFFGDMADGGGLIDHMKMDLSGAGQEAGQALGQAASDKINADAAAAGDTIGQRILSILNSWKPNINISGYSGNQGVNANVGKPATVTPPATSGQPSGGGW